MNIDDFIKEGNDVINKRQEEIDERKKQKIERAKMVLLGNLGIGDRIYGKIETTCTGVNIDIEEYPCWDSVTQCPYKIEMNVSDEEFARLEEHLRKTDNPHYKNYIKQIRKIEESDKPMTKSKKIVLTIVSAIVFIILFAIIVGIRFGEGFYGPGILGLIATSVFFYTLSIIWKKKK